MFNLFLRSNNFKEIKNTSGRYHDVVLDRNVFPFSFECYCTCVVLRCTHIYMYLFAVSHLLFFSPLLFFFVCVFLWFSNYEQCSIVEAMCNVEGPPLKRRRPQPLPETEPRPIYLDYNATTPLCDEAWEAMAAVRRVWGNPSSTHPYGLAARFALDAAREKVRRALFAPSVESIIFTSGGTESNNLAIVGAAWAVREEHAARRIIVSTNVEHPAVEKVLLSLKEKSGQQFEIVVAPVDRRTGLLNPEDLRRTLREIEGGAQQVALVTVMFANNELGSVNDIGALVRVTKEECGQACCFHTDAAQALGKVPVQVEDLGVDLLSVCGHKFYAPKGSGALYIRPGTRVRNTTFGAGHERGIRPGTENVLVDTGMAAALLLAVENMERFTGQMRATRDELSVRLREALSDFNMDYEVNGDLSVALPNTLNCAVFKRVPDKKAGLPVTYISAARLIMTVGDQVCMSAGSACHSTADGAEIEVSGPLKAVGVTLERAIGTLRLSTGRETTLDDVRRAAKIIARHAAQQFAQDL